MANLFQAASKARQGKSKRPDVEDWWLRREVELTALREELLTSSYHPGGYHYFEIHEPKRRVIAAAPFRDRVVHHALCNFLAPVLQRRFIARSFSCQVGKGTTAARECCRELTNRYRFVLKCDVSKFFPSIDHEILYTKLADRLYCNGVLGLIRKVLDSFKTGGEIPSHLFLGDDLVEVACRARGLPIGNLTSQRWGNYYLDVMDHWATETEQHGAYLRYTDDFLFFSDDKRRLWELRSGVVEQLAVLRLKLAEPKSRLLATKEGVPFCGFRFLPGLRSRILGASKRRFEARRTGWSRSRDFRRMTQGVFAWYQFSREANATGLRQAYGRWPLVNRLGRRRRKTSRVVRGGSWNNNNRDNLRVTNRNDNDPDNRNNNIGFRCVMMDGTSRKAEPTGEMRGGIDLQRQCQESSLTVTPAPWHA